VHVALPHILQIVLWRIVSTLEQVFMRVCHPTRIRSQYPPSRTVFYTFGTLEASIIAHLDRVGSVGAPKVLECTLLDPPGPGNEVGKPRSYVPDGCLVYYTHFSYPVPDEITLPPRGYHVDPDRSL
jgi:hypothetical protein